MASVMEILVRARDEASAKLKAVGDATKTAGSRISRMSDGMASAGRKMSLGLTLPIIGLGKVAFDAASDLNESMSKVGVVFGKNKNIIIDWSKNAATALGMSQQQALEAAGTYGNLFQAMKIGRGPATEMSKGLVNLSADLASFNNMDPTEVLDALRSGLAGETEPLKRLGVNLNQVRIEEEAVRLGLMKTGGELDAAAKAQATYSLIMQDTTMAQGDFARTADGAANQQRIMAAQFKDAAATLGQKLLPLGTKLIGWVSGLFTWFKNLSPEGQRWVMVIGGIVAAIGPLLLITAKLVQAFQVVKSALVAVNIASKLAFLTNPAFLAGAAIITIVVLIIKNWGHVKAFLLKIWNAIKKAAFAVWNAIKAFFLTVTNATKNVILAVWNTIKAAVIAVWSGIRTAARTAWNLIKTIVMAPVNALKGLLRTAWEAIKTGAVGAWNGLTGAVGAIWDGLMAGLKAGANVMIGIVNGVIKGFNLAIRGANLLNPFEDIPFIPEIPYLKKGGLVMKTGLAVVHEGEMYSGVGQSYRDLLGTTGKGGNKIEVFIDRRRWVEQSEFETAYRGF